MQYRYLLQACVCAGESEVHEEQGAEDLPTSSKHVGVLGEGEVHEEQGAEDLTGVFDAPLDEAAVVSTAQQASLLRPRHPLDLGRGKWLYLCRCY